MTSSPTRAILNDFIAVRGRSGSSRGSSLIAKALSSQFETLITTPRREPRSKSLRLLNMLYWDFIYIPIRALKLKCKVVIHGTNTGGACFGVPTIVVMHDTMVLDHPSLFNRQFVLYAKLTFSLSVRFASLIVTPSEHSKNRVLARWPSAQVRVIPWPVFMAEPRTDGPRSPKSKTILIVSSVDKHKRLPMAVAVVAAIRDSSGENFTAHFVVRPGNDLIAFEEALTRLDPRKEWTTVVSGITDADLVDAYDKAFCLLVSSIDEGFCLPAAEASLAGLPIAHTGRGAISEIVPLATAVPADPADDLGILITQINAFREELTWKRLSDEGFSRAGQFDHDVFAMEWSKAINLLITK